MLKRDFILALIEDFFKALTQLINQRENGNTDLSLSLINKCYASLHLDEDQRLNTNMDQLAELLGRDEKPAVPFMEIVGGLLLEESYLTEGKEKILLERSLEILQYVDQNDNTFSFDRLGKIELIRSMLENGSYGKL